MCAELFVERCAAEEEAVVDRADQKFVCAPRIGVDAQVAALYSPIDDRLDVGDAGLDDSLLVGAGELRIGRELGDEAVEDRTGQGRAEDVDRPAGEAGQLLSRVSEVAGRPYLLEPVEQNRQRELFLAAVAPVDGRLADPRAGGNTLDGEATDADLLEEVPGCVEDRLVGAGAEADRPSAIVFVDRW